MLSKFSCGCIGIPNQPQALVLCPCDTDRDDGAYAVFYRDLSDKSHEPLSQEETNTIVSDLGNLVCNGYRLQTILHILEVSKTTR